MSKKEPAVSITVTEDDGLVFALPSEANRFMTDTEAFLAACFTVWISAEADSNWAKEVKNDIITFAKATVGEVEEETNSIN